MLSTFNTPSIAKTIPPAYKNRTASSKLAGPHFSGNVGSSIKEKATDHTAGFLQDTFVKTLSEEYLTTLLESSEAKKVMKTIFTPKYLHDLMKSSKLQEVTKTELEALLTKQYLTKLLESAEATKVLKETLTPEYVKELVNNSNLQGVAKAQLSKLLQDAEFQKETNQCIKKTLSMLVQDALPSILQMSAGAASLVVAESQESENAKNLLRSNGGYQLAAGAHKILGLQNAQRSQLTLGATSIIASQYLLPESYKLPAKIFGAMSIAASVPGRYKPHEIISKLAAFPGLGSLSNLGQGIVGLWQNPKLSLTEAATKGDLKAVEKWIELHADLNKTDKAGWTPLQIVIEKGLNTIAQKLIQEGDVDLNKQSKEGWTPLLIAAFLDNQEIANILIGNNKVELDKAAEGELTPFQIAVAKGHTEIAKALINTHKIELDRLDKEGLTPLQFAVNAGYTEIALALINTQKVDLNKLDKNGRSPLQVALAKGHTEIAKALIDTNKVDLTHQDKEGWTPLGLAVFMGHAELIDELSKSDPEVAEAKALLAEEEKKAHQAFREAAGKGDLKRVYDFIIAGVDLNSAPLHGKTALYHAAENGHAPVVKALSKAGANADQPSLYGWSPLHHAALKGHEQVVQALKDAGANLGKKTLQGETAHEMATKQSHTNIANLLKVTDQG